MPSERERIAKAWRIRVKTPNIRRHGRDDRKEERTVNALVRTLHPFGPDKYATEDGWLMRREHGETPNGNPIAGRWVLRNERGEWVDVDQYRSDLAERNSMAFAFSPNAQGQS